MTSAELLKHIDNHIAIMDEHQKKRMGGTLIIQTRAHLRDMLANENKSVSVILDSIDAASTEAVSQTLPAVQRSYWDGYAQGMRACFDQFTKRNLSTKPKTQPAHQ